jgi:hypothetical protein
MELFRNIMDKNPDIHVAGMGDSFSNGQILFEIKNDAFPDIDDREAYEKFPPPLYPERLD